MEETRLTTAIITVLFTGIIGITGYWLKTVYAEVKALLKELTTYINELTKAVVILQTQVDKQIETDIQELKYEVEKVKNCTIKHGKQISAINKESKHRNA